MDEGKIRDLNERGSTWAVVLAGGEGSRLRDITTTASGVAVPKQFCSLRGGPSLLSEALQRGASVAHGGAVCTVVARQHARWWRRELEALPRENIVVQPRNRGTAIGILLPLISILDRDPNARVLVLPSDHYVGDEAVLRQALVRAVAAVDERGSRIVLLGMEPETPDSELGYIVPERAGANLSSVRQFVEKPPEPVAQSLIARGALWNVFVLAARADVLAAFLSLSDPSLLSRVRAANRRGSNAIDALYRELPSIDFSRHLARDNASLLSVLPVPSCGWTDLGTVERLQRTLAGSPALRTSAAPAARGEGRLSLQRQHAQWQRLANIGRPLAEHA